MAARSEPTRRGRPPGAVSVELTCRGHPDITATHAKTLELTRDPEISRRATCVVGVGSDHDDRALLALRGEVGVTLECDGARDSFTATMSPFFLGDTSLVFRRGPGLRGRTVAFGATKAAADLDRALIARLASTGRELHVTVRAAGGAPGPGVLYVVSLPIGNDGDLAPRAIEVLERVDVVLAEDTRRLHGLARRVGFTPARASSYHEHNEHERAEAVLERLRRGGRVALVSDAGTPLCSDPGYRVVSRAVAEGIAVSPVPGPSATLAVVAASGLPVDHFVFAGFLPRRSAARRQALQGLTAPGFAVVCFEAAARLPELLADVAAVCPRWRVCVGREITKTFEEFRHGLAAELAAAADRARGECALVLAPPADAGDARRGADGPAGVEPMLRALLAQGVPVSTLVQALRSLPGVGRNDAYDRVLALARDAGGAGGAGR